MYKNIPHITEQDVLKIFNEHPNAFVYFNEKIDGAPVRIGKCSNGNPYIQTGRSSRIFCVGEFKAYTEEKTNNQERIRRAAAYDDLFNILLNELKIFDMFAAHDFLDFECLSEQMSSNSSEISKVSPNAWTDFLNDEDSSVEKESLKYVSVPYETKGVKYQLMIKDASVNAPLLLVEKELNSHKDLKCRVLPTKFLFNIGDIGKIVQKISERNDIIWEGVVFNICLKDGIIQFKHTSPYYKSIRNK